jgi:AraC-like DNA-binding protein
LKRWNTAVCPEPEQYSYWREAVCEAFAPLRPTELGRKDSWQRSGLPGWVNAHPLGDMNGTEIAACDQSIHHGRNEVARTELDVLFVNLMLSGRCVVRQGKSKTVSTPGTFAVVDATEPFRIDYLETWRTISFRVPKATLQEGLPDEARGFTFGGSQGIGAIVADTMRSVWSAAPNLSTQQGHASGTGFTALLESALKREPVAELISNATSAESLRSGIEKYISTNVLEADLSPAAVAKRFAISVRKLHQLYETAPNSFSQTVMRIRVDRCAADLVALDGKGTLTELAAKWGFTDLSHMNRTFYRQLGSRPSDYLRERNEIQLTGAPRALAQQ